jgi:hypothetical protein
VAARCLNRRRNSFGTLKASASRLAVLSAAMRAGAGEGGGGEEAGAVRWAASGMGAACSLVRASRSTAGRLLMVFFSLS